MSDPSELVDRPAWVVCTAGHVDHGKSTLVAALTGTDPDHLAEEQRRGLTIDLGFAWADLPGLGEVAFVDLPGHERFVPNMLVGAGAVSTVLFVVAADVGWMPQSAEHLEIIDQLGIADGVVALTRTDLVDADTTDLAVELVREELIGSSLAEAPIVAVSAITGDGLGALTDALGTVLDEGAAAVDGGRPRLWVDRSFSIAGAGTVVTGTLVGGSLSAGDELALWPTGSTARVRGLQTRGRRVERVGPGRRVAVNLAATSVEDVPRGSMLGRGADWRTTTSLHVWARPARGRRIGRRGAWTVHVGTAAVPASLYPLTGADLEVPGPVRIELATPLTVAAGDRMVLRDAGPGGTAGGAVVLDPAPGPRVRGADRRHAAVRAATVQHAAESAEDRLVALVEAHEQVDADELVALANATRSDLASALDGGRAHHAPPFVLSDERWRSLSRLAVRAVIGTHERRPALSVVDPSIARRLLATADADPALAEAVLRRVVADGLIEAIPGGYRGPGHEPRLTGEQQVARQRLLALLLDAGAEAVDLAAAAEQAGADEDLLTALIADGQLVEVEAGRALSREAIDAAVRILGTGEGPLTVADVRDLLGTSRRHVVPFLETTDRLGLTRRDGDVRQVNVR